MSWRRGFVAVCGGWAPSTIEIVTVSIPRTAAAAGSGPTDLRARGVKTSAGDKNNGAEVDEKKQKKSQRPPSPYAVFVKQQWQELTAAGGLQVSFKEAAQEVRERWKSITPAARAALEAEVEKVRQDWVKTNPPKPKRKAKLSAYNCFVKERLPELRAADSSKKVSDTMKEASAEWKTLPAFQKASYQATADKLNSQQEAV